MREYAAESPAVSDETCTANESATADDPCQAMDRISEGVDQLSVSADMIVDSLEDLVEHSATLTSRVNELSLELRQASNVHLAWRMGTNWLLFALLLAVIHYGNT